MTKAMDRRGFSLLELLIYVALLAIVILITATVFLSITRGQGRITSQNEVNSALRFAGTKIAQDIRTASSVTTPASAGSSSSTLTLVIGGTDTTYCLAGNQLRRQAGGTCNASSEAITPTTVIVNSLSFTRLENTNATLAKTIVSVSLSISASYNSSSTDYQYSQSLQTSASLLQ